MDMSVPSSSQTLHLLILSQLSVIAAAKAVADVALVPEPSSPASKDI